MKLFHVIATSVLGTAMALGTGFALANRQNNVKEARADSLTFTAGTDTGDTSVTKSPITISMSTMSRDDNYRVYGSTDMTVTSSSGSITGINLTCTGSGTSNYGPGKLSGTGYTYSGTSGTWSGSSTQVTLSASSQVRITEIVVTYSAGGVDPEPTTEHAGTAADPYSVADALAVTPSSGTLSGKYVKGIVIGSAGIDTGYGNATFEIGDTLGASETLTIFRAKDIGNVKFTDANKFKSGDTVTVFGGLTTYSGTRELSGGYLTAIEAGEEPEPEYKALSWFYEDDHITQTASGPYDYKGTVIGIVGNSYYLQEGDYGIMVYGGSKTPPTGMKVGDLVHVNSKVINYNGYLMESNGTPTAEILGEGTLPAATIVNSFSAFDAVNQSTYVTFNGLKLKGESFVWDQEINLTDKKDGIATVVDSSGNDVTLFLSRFAEDQENIITKLEGLSSTDTFDVAKGVKAIASGGSAAGTAQLSLFDANNITIHHSDADLVQDWIDEYMFMDDESFDGDGTGKCISDNLYITAKRALIALGEENVTKFRTNDGNKYTDALARYNEWARINGDTKPFEGNEIVPASLVIGNNTVQSNLAVVIVTMSVVALVSSVGFFLVIRKRKHQ